MSSVTIPPHMEHLPLDKHGRPIPWFVAELLDGSRDFRIARRHGVSQAVTRSLCWVCGRKRTNLAAFVIGPMCAVNRNNAEPPCHQECALYSVKACPFLSRPEMRRRDTDIPDDVAMPGMPILRNPGVAGVWVSKTWKPYAAMIPGGEPGLLFDLGDPVAVSWWTAGRSATGDEVRAAIDSGMPKLAETLDADDKQGRALLTFYRRRVEEMLPA